LENYNSSGGILCFALHFEKIPPGFYLLNESKISSKIPFFSKILLCKILGGGRVAFNKNFLGGRGYVKPPPSHTPPPPKLMYE
jgi:hypothetical protein